jgi:hypothetical protein
MPVGTAAYTYYCLLDLIASAGGQYSFGDPSAPAVVVCTPRHFAELVRGPVITQESLFESVEHVVLDEVPAVTVFPY